MTASRRELLAGLVALPAADTSLSGARAGGDSRRPSSEIVMRDGLREIKRYAVECGRAREPWSRIPPAGSIYREFYDLADYALRKAGRS